MPGVCSRCLREVYFAEEKLALGKVWHNFCFSCRNCRKLLDSWTVATHSGELYCKNCHNRLFPTKSVRPTLPSIGSPIFPPGDTAAFAVSPCESLTDVCCCCCCHCNDESDFIDPRSGGENLTGSSPFTEAKQRMRGGGGEDDEIEVNQTHLAFETGGAKKNSDNEEDSQLDAQSFVTTLCDPPSSPIAVTAWHNKHHSASQSTFSPPSSAQRAPIRPSSTPAAGEITAAGENIPCHCFDNRKPGSPCRTNHKHHGHLNRCHRHFCRDIQRADKIVGSQERGKFVKDYKGENFVANYRNLLRSRSPGGRSCGGGGCSPNQSCQQQDDGFGISCEPKIPSGCECLGGGQDCQRCGRKVYQAEMQIASGVPYHNICFSCFCCRKPLETLTYHENCGEIYCKQCYVRNFGPQGYGYAGVLQTPM